MQKLNKCLFCNTETLNKFYCSKACSNRAQPRRRKKNRYYCEDCGVEVYRRRFCPEHHPTAKLGRTTIGFHEQKAIESMAHPSWGKSPLRYHCRKLNSHRPKVCQVCGYSIHIEYCHIKGIAKLPKDTTLNVVNDPSNVAILCRNHHWELDHGFLVF